MLCRKTAQLCSVNRSEAEELHSTPLRQGGSGQPDLQTQQNNKESHHSLSKYGDLEWEHLLCIPINDVQ